MLVQSISLTGLMLYGLASAAEGPNPPPDEYGRYWIYGTGIKAAFVPYAASISNLIIKDRWGIERDLVTGFDNASYYSIDRQHQHSGGVVGRYANRIKNSSFEMDGAIYKTPPNEHPTYEHPDGVDTLHGGPDGWDYRDFLLETYSSDSVTFSLVDPDGKEGFPGEVICFVTYTVGNMTWDFKMVAIATTKRTPIMLTSHTYWNLDGFANNQTQSVLNHSFYLPYGGQRVEVDSILVPTGNILANEPGSVNDFWSAPKQVGHSFSDHAIQGNCGENCAGYDNCWLVNREQADPKAWREDGNFVARLQSPWSGIQLDVYSDQDAFQMYSCNGQNGSMALKSTQGIHDDPEFPRTIPQYGCVVLEVQDWIDGINQHEWQRQKKQIFGPGDDPYVLHASYRFSINESATES